MQLSVMRVRPDALLPVRATPGSAGYDVHACLERPLLLAPGQTTLVPTGIAMALAPGYAALIYARSGLAVRHGIAPANCVGVIDSDYRGEVLVGLRNHSSAAFTIAPGDRIAQMVISRCETPELVLCEALEDTARGAGGFGSTGGSAAPASSKGEAPCPHEY